MSVDGVLWGVEGSVWFWFWFLGFSLVSFSGGHGIGF